MTTIAWDGTSLAADRLATQGNARIGFVAKAARAHGSRILAGTGDFNVVSRVLGDGTVPASLPDSVAILEILPDGTARRYENGGSFPVEAPHALGSGRDFALAAMACGKTAAEAVEIACRFDVWSGGGVDVLRLGEG